MMLQKSLAIAVALGALAIGVALAYHGRQLVKVSERLAQVSERLHALEQGTTALDRRLEHFSQDLPALVEQGGRDAGRQAVHGVIEEAFAKPLNRIKAGGLPSVTNAWQQLVSIAEADGLFTNRASPWLRFDIPDPVIHIHVLPGLKELPDLPWLSAVAPWLMDLARGRPPAATNQSPQSSPADPPAGRAP